MHLTSYYLQSRQWKTWKIRQWRLSEEISAVISVQPADRRRQIRSKRTQEPCWVYQLSAGAVQRLIWWKHYAGESVQWRQHRRRVQRWKRSCAGKLIRCCWEQRQRRRWRIRWKMNGRWWCNVIAQLLKTHNKTPVNTTNYYYKTMTFNFLYNVARCNKLI